MIELVAAYAPFANGGMAVAAHAVERVRTRAGKMLYVRAPHNYGRIIDARNVAMMNAMMRETIVSGTAKGAQLPGWQAAGKTGTSQEFRDAWFVGYTGASGDRRLARQRRFEPDQEGDRRRHAGRSLESLHARGAPGRAGRGATGPRRSRDCRCEFPARTAFNQHPTLRRRRMRQFHRRMSARGKRRQSRAWTAGSWIRYSDGGEASAPRKPQ